MTNPIIASVENMHLHYADGVIAYSKFTGEEYSANPGDYFMVSDDYTLTDENDDPMILVTLQTHYVDVVSGI